MIEIYKYFGLLAPLFVAVAALYILWRWPAEKKMTFSEHIAKDKRSFLLFGMTLFPATVMYYFFLYLYIGPRYNLPFFYFAILAVAFICQIIFTFVPSSSGRARTVHLFSASFVGFSMFVLSVVVVVYGLGLSVLSLTVLWSFIILSILMAARLIIARIKSDRLLIYEVFYILMFWLITTVLAYS